MTTVSREELLVRLNDGLRAADRLNIALIAHIARRFPNDVPSADVEKAMVEWETARDALPSYDECQRLADKPADDGVREVMESLADWCSTERAKLGAVEGYDYESGEERGLRRVELEITKRALSTKAKP